MKCLGDFDLQQNELLNAAIQKLSTAPSSAVQGQIYFNTTDKLAYIYDGSSWVALSGSTSSETSDSLYEHNIKITGAYSNAAGVQVFLTMINNKSGSYYSVSELAAAIYGKGNTSNTKVIQASGRVGTSSTSFNGFAIGIYASTSSSIDILYITTGGSISSISYSATMFSTLNDTVTKIN